MQSSIQQLNEPTQYTQQSIKYTYTTNMGRTHTSSVVNPCSYGSHMTHWWISSRTNQYTCIYAQSCWPYCLSLSLLVKEDVRVWPARLIYIYMYMYIHMQKAIQVCFTTQGLCQCTHNLHICIQSPSFPSVQCEFGTCTLMCVHVYTIQSSHLYVHM